MRCVRTPRSQRAYVHVPTRRYTSSGSQEGVFRSMLRKLNPVNAYRDTKRLVNSVRDFGLPEYSSALRSAALMEKKLESIISKTEAREKELEQERLEFQKRMEVELGRLKATMEDMVCFGDHSLPHLYVGPRSARGVCAGSSSYHPALT